MTLPIGAEKSICSDSETNPTPARSNRRNSRNVVISERANRSSLWTRMTSHSPASAPASMAANWGRSSVTSVNALTPSSANSVGAGQPCAVQ